MRVCVLVVDEFDLARTVLKSAAFAPLDMEGLYRRIVARTGLDFSATLRVFEALPPFLSGGQHQQVRKTMAAIIAAGRERQRAAIESALDSLVAERFARQGSFDLVADFARPLWYALSAEIVGDRHVLDPQALSSLAEDMPTLFSPTASLARRQAINDAIQAFLDADAAESEQRLVALCLSALGSRPFIGAFALTIFRVIEHSGPIAAEKINWPAVFSESGLDYVDRVARDDGLLGLPELAKGRVVRSPMGDVGYSAEEKVHLLFGLGAHTCLGKSIAQYAWTQFVKRACQLDTNLLAKELVMKPFAEPFRMPDKAIVTVGER